MARWLCLLRKGPEYRPHLMADEGTGVRGKGGMRDAGYLAGVALAALTAIPAHGEDAAGNPVIVVTAPLASDVTALEDVPGNAQVLSGDPLARQNHANLADLLNASLGSVSLSNGTGNPFQSDLSYRGFQATSLLGSPTGLSVYLDGVRMNEPFGANVNWDLVPLNAVSSVEVLPGSNPLFGLNTLGGALVLTTRNGAEDGGLGASVQTGSFARRAVQAEAGGTLAAGALDWFVAGNYDRQDGYRDHTGSDVRQAYGKVRWHGGASHAELGAVWADTTLHGTQALPLSLLDHPRMAYTWPDSIANRQLIVNLKAESRLAPAVTLSGNAYFRRSNAIASNSNAGLDDNCGEDCSNLAPGGTVRDGFADYTGPLALHDYTSAINTAVVGSSIRQRTFGGNVLLDIDTALFGLDNDLNLGGSIEISRIRYGQTTTLAQLIAYQSVPLAWNTRYASDTGFQGDPRVADVGVRSRNRSYSLFVRDMIKPTRTLSLTGSLGFTATYVSLDGANRRYLGEDGDAVWTGNDGKTHYNPAYIGALTWGGADTGLIPVTAPADAVAGPEIAPVVGTHRYHRFNPAFGLAWNPVKALGLFASYSEAMRAPTAIELACADPGQPCALPTGFNGDPALKPVVARTIELGGRGTLGRHLGWNLALYRTRLQDDIQFIFDGTGLGWFANVGRTERKGVELGVTADFATVHLSASYGHVDARYRSGFIDAQGDAVIAGNRITGIPADTVKLRAVYAPARTVALGATLQAVAHQYAHGDEANRDSPVPGYALVSLDAHVRPVEPFELFATVTNLFDRRFATFGVQGTNVYSGQDEQFRTPAPGRAVTLGVRLTLGRKAAPGPDRD